MQPVTVGGLHIRGEEGREPADTCHVLRIPTVEHHQPPVRAVSHLLPLPLYSLPVGNMDQRVPTSATTFPFSSLARTESARRDYDGRQRDAAAEAGRKYTAGFIDT